MGRLAWRLLWRELRSGELRLLFAALVLAVAVVSSIGFFTERVRLALQREANQLLAADLLLIADHPLPARYAQEASQLGLNTAETRIFPSMVLAEGGAQLADIKAVSAAYPLRGQLAVQREGGQAAIQLAHGPAAGQVWLDERLASTLGVKPGGRVRLGEATLTVDALLTYEPDRSMNFMSMAPRLLMSLDDLPKTGLEQPGSRLSYRFLVAGEASTVAALRERWSASIGRGERLEDAANVRPETRSALDQTTRFLGLAAMLTTVLAALAVALAARRYMARHLDACAVMRCLGMTRRTLLMVHGQQLLLLAVLATGLGGAMGMLLHQLLVHWLGSLLGVDLPASGLFPVLHAGGVAVLLLLAFAFPPLWQLSAVPALRVLRQELASLPPALWLSYLLGWLALSGLMVVVSGDVLLGGRLVLGFSAMLLVNWAVAWGALRLLGRYAYRGPFVWRFALGSLCRHAASSAVQLVALALGLSALLLLTVVRGELLDTWQKRLPADAPNRFVINIQPEQVAPLAAWLQERGISAELAPMVRARLLAIGTMAVTAAAYPDDERAQRLVEREFNLSWRSALPPGNRLTAGEWFPENSAGLGLASLEAGLAKTLGIKLGDELRFTLAGQEVRVRVSSLRQVDWDSMRVNFFVLMPPGVLAADQASYVTSFHLPGAGGAFARDLTHDFPNLTLLDVGGILDQLQAVMGRLVNAVQFVSLFSLLAGSLVLYTALQSVMDERRQAIGVLRALGATQRQLRSALLIEFGLLGGMAGLLAAGGAIGVGRILARQVFQFEWSAPPYLPLFAMVLGGALVLLVVSSQLASILRTPPAGVLR